MASQGYGVEVWCTDTLHTGRYARGALVVAQAAYRRLITPRGTLRGSDEASTYGFDVAAFVGAIGTAAAVRALPFMVRAELLKDDRIAEVDVQASLMTAANGEISIDLIVSAALHYELGSFELTMSVSEAAVRLVGATES